MDNDCLRDHCASRLPTFRHVDILPVREHKPRAGFQQPGTTTSPPLKAPLPVLRSSSFPSYHRGALPTSPKALPTPSAPSQPIKPVARQAPPNTSQEWVEESNEPTMITRWVAQQSIPLSPSGLVEDSKPRSAEKHSQTLSPGIPPIRGFKSARNSDEMNATPSDRDDNGDLTLRGFDHANSRQPANKFEQEEQNSDDSDLFLKVAQEEELARQNSTTNDNSLNSLDSRKSRGTQRQTIPPPSSPPSRRRISHQQSLSASRVMEERDSMAQVLHSYRPGRDSPAGTALDDFNRSRFPRVNSRSNPTTPRVVGNGDARPNSPVFNGGRRGSVPEPSLPTRTSYRQSNLSYSTPRTYNSSPLISRTTETNEMPEAARAPESTESTVSTTAPSTVWDELEDLKSRIHRLELTGKLPATSGAAISRASNERPATATTTVTTISSSPKRGRGNSISPTESLGVTPVLGETHPLLRSALANSKPLLSPEVYAALEAAAADALAVAAMMGSSGQPGPISSSQSTVGGGISSVSDRQVRRKADSMCRSLTELCLALSEGKSPQGPPVAKQNASRPSSGDTAIKTNIESSNTYRQPASADLDRVTPGPRALSRLEARRSVILSGGSSLQSPRYEPSENTTPTQPSTPGRRTSLLLRRRLGTEEPEEVDQSRFRAPSRATTEVGLFRSSPRDLLAQHPLPDHRSPTAQSALPVRRHYASSSLTNNVLPVLPPLSNRKFFDRATPERDTTSAVQRLIDDRAQRRSSIGPGFALGRTQSLSRRRQPNGTDSSTAVQADDSQ